MRNLCANFPPRELLFSCPNGVILSTDDYFAHRDGYHYDPGRLGEAHELNQIRGICTSSDPYSCYCLVSAVGLVVFSAYSDICDELLSSSCIRAISTPLLYFNVYPLSAKNAMHDGRSPIIIDNTNIQAWEMKPYVSMVLDFSQVFVSKEPNFLRTNKGF